MERPVSNGIEISKDGEQTLVVLRGSIDEHTDLEAIAQDISGGSVKIDASGVSRINSCGVREWINFMRQMSSVEVSLYGCSVPFVIQLNAIFNLRGHATVASIAVPVWCDECENGSEQVISLPDGVTDPHEILRNLKPCSECGGEMEFDGLIDRYFLFLEYA